MDERIEVLLADADALLRAGLRALLELEPDVRVVAEAESGDGAVRAACLHLPRVVVMELEITGLDGLEAATRRIAAHGPAVLVLTWQDEHRCLFPALAAGVHGYVQKTRADEEVTEAVRTAARDEVYLSPAAMRLLLLRHRAAGHAPAPGALTGEEEDLLRLAAEGRAASQIARLLRMDPGRVRAVRAVALGKLGLGRREEVAAFAARAALRGDDGARPPRVRAAVEAPPSRPSANS